MTLEILEPKKKNESTSNSNSSNNTQSTNSNKSGSNNVFVNDPAGNGSYNYFDLHGTAAKKGSTQNTIQSLNDILNARNEEEKAESVIHGMSDAEYEEYRKYMYEQYGIQLERGYNYGNFQNVAVAMGESCSQGTRYSAMCKAAQSYDSVLDLVLDAKLTAAIADIFNGDTDPNWDRLASSGNAGRLLKEYGIKIVKCADRQWSVSLVDENGNVIQDSEGHLAQLYKNDYLLPDGQAQQNEVQLGAALDAMGFDCWSVMDLSSEEYEMVKELAGKKNSELGTSSGISGGDEMKIRNQVLGSYDKATKTWTKAKKQDNSAWINGTYTDKVTGQTMSAKKRYSQFVHDRDSGVYKGKKGADFGSSDYSYAFKNKGEFNQEAGVNSTGYNGSSGANGTSYASGQIENSAKELVSLLRFDQIVKEIMEEEKCTKTEAEIKARKKYRTFRDSE